MALGAALGMVGAVRRSRPVHSVGTVVPGTLIVNAPADIGSPLFDSAGRMPATVRLSRSASWPTRLPDVIGIAVRIPGGGEHGGPADLLFASTGTGALSRYVLQLHSSATGGPLTTMLPLTGPAGTVVFRLDPDEPDRYRLSCSRSSGPWEPLGELVLAAASEPAQRSNHPAGLDDPGLRFRPVANTPSGLRTPPWLRAARAPAYGIARLVWHRSGGVRTAG